MGLIQKPMLAGRPESLEDIRLPCIVSPKLDGIRCIRTGGKALSRNLKPIPNRYIRAWLEANVPSGFDGELMVRNGTFQDTASGIMSEDGEPDWFYAAFDYVRNSLQEPFALRIENLRLYIKHHENKEFRKRVWFVPQYHVGTIQELQAKEAEFVAQGYEGIMIRAPDGPYKCGRSSVREGYLLKVKRFEDSEAVVTAVLELNHNENEAEKDELGHTKHSHKKAGMVAGGTLGSLSVKDVTTGVEFEVGTGFSGAMRELIWKHRDDTVGKIIKYRFQSAGVKEKPRFPVFIAWRDERDMGEP